MLVLVFVLVLLLLLLVVVVVMVVVVVLTAAVLGAGRLFTENRERRGWQGQDARLHRWGLFTCRGGHNKSASLMDVDNIFHLLLMLPSKKHVNN